jgi:divalent metal cation (Fe/Co/Zn/Cd) transporter
MHFWANDTPERAAATIALKAGAYLLTGSVGLLSDAVESLVNLAGALMALWMLTVAARGPDDEHAFSHTKAEYFSSGVEGVLIVVAAVSIAVAAVHLCPRTWPTRTGGPATAPVHRRNSKI